MQIDFRKTWYKAQVSGLKEKTFLRPYFNLVPCALYLLLSGYCNGLS